MQAQQDRAVNQRPTERPAIYKVEQYARKTGLNAARLFREKGLPYYNKMPGVKSVRAYQGRFGFGPMSHDIEIWLELEDMAALMPGKNMLSHTRMKSWPSRQSGISISKTAVVDSWVIGQIRAGRQASDNA